MTEIQMSMARQGLQSPSDLEKVLLQVGWGTRLVNGRHHLISQFRPAWYIFAISNRRNALTKVCIDKLERKLLKTNRDNLCISLVQFC